MDIARPEFKRQKRRRQIIWAAIGLIGLVAVTIGVSRLKPAAPEVERSTVWTDIVKRGPMLRQVRGLGSLIPSQEFTRQIPAETEATVVRIRKLPGSQVQGDTILLEMLTFSDLVYIEDTSTLALACLALDHEQALFNLGVPH